MTALRQVGVPLSTVKELLALGPAEMAEQVAAFWREAETRHAGQRELVTALVDRLTGRSTVMYEVATREMPQRRRPFGAGLRRRASTRRSCR